MFKDLDSVINTEHNQSAKYNLINSDEILCRLVDNGWTMASVSEKKVKHPGKQFHIAKLEHPNLMIGDDPINLVYSNSHDGKAAARFRLGLFRMVCGNGLVAGNDLIPSMSIPHNQQRTQDAINAVIEYMVYKAKDLAHMVKVMQSVALIQAEKEALATKALKIKGFKEINKYQIQSVLDANRVEDRGIDLWRTYNTIQESIENGLYMLDENGRGREIRSEVKKLDFNTKLFDAAIGYAA